MVRSTAAPSPISILVIPVRGKMELGRSGRPMLTHDADGGFAWSGWRKVRPAASAASYGVFDNRSPNSAALTWCA